MAKILVVSSQIHQTLSTQQLSSCTAVLDNSSHDYDVEMLSAGTYEIPYVINAYAKNKTYDAYIALGLVLKINIDHYEYIMSHIKQCFTHFALNSIIVGNGIISGSSIDELTTLVNSQDPCKAAHLSACKAVQALLSLEEKLAGSRKEPVTV